MSRSGKPKLLIFIVAYNAETTIRRVLRRIPARVFDDYDAEILIIDDFSRDGTFEAAAAAGRELAPAKVTVLVNGANQGYGGNQKLGYRYATEHGFDYVALVHGDGQYAPECLPELLGPLVEGRADAVFGSRMMIPGGARRGGMPLYKFIGNRILTTIQNRLLRMRLSEFHSGYRIYSVAALRRVPFALNSNGFDFDTEIIIQLKFSGARIVELPIPTYYGDEISHVNGIAYALAITRTTILARAQELNLFHDPKFDCAPARYESKVEFDSTHSWVLGRVKPGARVLDIGCADGGVAARLRAQGCFVVGIDSAHPVDPSAFDRFVPADLDAGLPAIDMAGFDHVLLLDVIEHLRRPEEFVAGLRAAMQACPGAEAIISTGNIGFILTRLALLAGQFNYGRRGILDLTHLRLFTFRSIRRLFVQAGFDVVSMRGIPVPFPLALGPGRMARLLLAINRALIWLRPQMFAFQSIMVVRARPDLGAIMAQTQRHTAARRAAG